MNVEWGEKFKTGIGWLDAQHSELIEAFSRLVAAMDAGEGGVETIKIIKFLERYVVYHFASEERAMQETLYPGTVEHKALHLTFRNMIMSFKRDLDARGASYYLTIQARNALVEWLSIHICGEDKKLSKYLIEKGYSDTPPPE